ncbi:MAG: ABC transporter permease [Clostridiales bacterium]|nr:ABC transporter permease [Clostridiales bacterium]
MRLKNLILGDMKFQYKYGFYAVYLILVILYSCILFALPEGWREKAADIMILTDPAAMGLFFMGAILMLEKSQRVINSIAVSPVETWEYIISKAVSISIISVLVALVLSLISGKSNVFGTLTGTFLGSIIFTMLGLWIAMKVKTLNSFMVCTVPIEIIFFVPAILYLFGIQSKWMLLLPACAIMHMYMGYDSYFFLCLLICVIWSTLILYLVNKTFAKVVRNMGGMKL